MLMQAESFLFSTYDAIAFEKCIDGNQVEKQMHQSENIRHLPSFLYFCVLKLKPMPLPTRESRSRYSSIELRQCMRRAVFLLLFHHTKSNSR